MFSEITIFAKEIALKAGEILREGFGTDFGIYNKEGINNLVTDYDNKSERLIISAINEKFPNHSILAEETGKSGEFSLNEIRWVIDPLDGTVNFAHNIPQFSVSIAAELNGEILSGVVYHPILNELFWAEKGVGAYFGDKKMRVSSNNDLLKSILVTGFPYNVNLNPNNCLTQFTNLIGKGIPVRRLGSAALDLAYVACGRFDGFWEVELNPWDTAAGFLLVEEAGGKVSQYNGEKYSIFDRTILATNGGIHQQMMTELK